VIVGIVGAEAAKFTTLGEQRARHVIRSILTEPWVDLLVSGGCHLGGADIYAEEEADELGIPKRIHKPARLSWEAGFKPRNILIATDAHIVHNIVVDQLPASYKGMRFTLCYHCKGEHGEHVKSGGCWTAKYAEKLGKPAAWHLIRNH
jgi:hypothetical protein